MQELRKAGLAIHLITQSTVDFGSWDLFESILANTPWQCWYQTLSPADQELGARVLTNATFDALAVHYTRTKQLHDGAAPVETKRGTTYLAQYRAVAEAYYKTPQLWEQEYRTKLATLRIGERYVRDRRGVRRERVVPVRSPWLRSITDTSTHALIERLRQQPIYQPCPLPESALATDAQPDAAARLRSLLRE